MHIKKLLGDYLDLSHKSFTTSHDFSVVISLIGQHGQRCNIESCAVEVGRQPKIANIDPKGAVKCLPCLRQLKGRKSGVISLNRVAKISGQ